MNNEYASLMSCSAASPIRELEPELPIWSVSLEFPAIAKSPLELSIQILHFSIVR